MPTLGDASAPSEKMIVAGENFDLTSDPGSSEARRSSPPRRYVGVHFACCNVYTRIYVNRAETAYVGYCPRCSRKMRLRVGPGGTDQRIFTAY